MPTALPDPIPAHVTEPEPGDDLWVDQLTGYLAELAGEAAADPDELAMDLVLAPSEYEGSTAPGLARAVHWRIDGQRSAEWAMAHYATADAGVRQLAAQADDWRLRIEHWFRQAAAPLLARRAFFDMHLQLWAKAERDRTEGRQKSQVLPSGTVRTTGSSARPKVLDEDTVVAWVDEVLPEDVRAVVAPSKRRVLISELGDFLQVVEVIDQAKLTLSDGDVISWLRGDPVGDSHVGMLEPGMFYGITCPGIGDGWPPDDADALVGQVEVLASHLEVRGPDGLPVPGMGIEPANVTAKVSPL